MSKKSVFTTITPIAAGVSRETVMATLHNHLEMIDLNPLVVSREACKAPSYASPEEYYATWYAITDKISYLPGGLATGSVTYYGCFNDLADGLQTHIYAPLGLELKSRWLLAGSLPGEPSQPIEMGLGIPRTGLYLREDVEMKCNIMMTSFVKKNLKKSHSTLVSRFLQKAHIVEVDKSNASLVSQGVFPPHRQDTASNPSTPAMSIASPSIHNSRLSTTSHQSCDSVPQSLYGQHPAQYPRSRSPQPGIAGPSQSGYAPYHPPPPPGHPAAPHENPHGHQYQRGYEPQPQPQPYAGQAPYPPPAGAGAQGKPVYVELPASDTEKPLPNAPVELPS